MKPSLSEIGLVERLFRCSLPIGKELKLTGIPTVTAVLHEIQIAVVKAPLDFPATIPEAQLSPPFRFLSFSLTGLAVDTRELVPEGLVIGRRELSIHVVEGIIDKIDVSFPDINAGDLRLGELAGPIARVGVLLTVGESLALDRVVVGRLEGHHVPEREGVRVQIGSRRLRAAFLTASRQKCDTDEQCNTAHSNSPTALNAPYAADDPVKQAEPR